ncbi:hypothetical protein DFH06DRAFT_1143266 [Mycena polygramma]|nr:hypothetical protein DFH06DRAFT_1143266 [Mycena polygramma]
MYVWSWWGREGVGGGGVTRIHQERPRSVTQAQAPRRRAEVRTENKQERMLQAQIESDDPSHPVPPPMADAFLSPADALTGTTEIISEGRQNHSLSIGLDPQVAVGANPNCAHCWGHFEAGAARFPDALHEGWISGSGSRWKVLAMDGKKVLSRFKVYSTIIWPLPVRDKVDRENKHMSSHIKEPQRGIVELWTHVQTEPFPHV